MNFSHFFLSVQGEPRNLQTYAILHKSTMKWTSARFDDYAAFICEKQRELNHLWVVDSFTQIAEVRLFSSAMFVYVFNGVDL